MIEMIIAVAVGAFVGGVIGGCWAYRVGFREGQASVITVTMDDLNKGASFEDVVRRHEQTIGRILNDR